jgi:hypothetical protein
MNTHTTFLKEDGTLWGMGDNRSGKLGIDPGVLTQITEPRMIASDVADFTTSYGNTIYIKMDGSAWGLGRNEDRQLTDTDQPFHFSPAAIGTDVKDIGINGSVLLVVKKDGTLWGQGSNHRGQLGLARALTTVYPAQQIATGVDSVELGEWNSYFIKQDGSLWGMGENGNGMLGDGSKQTRYLPVKIASGVTVVSAGPQHTVFIRDKRKTPEGRFKDWMADSGVPSGQEHGPLETPFGDGTPNLLKYAFNMRKDAPDQRRLSHDEGTAGLPYSGLAEGEFGSVFRIEYLRRKGAELVYTPQISSDLIYFHSLDPTSGEVIPIPSEPDWERVRVDIPYYPEWDTKTFGRVIVTLPDL